MHTQKIVTFVAEEVRKQIIVALEAKSHMPTLVELSDPKVHRGGVVKADTSGFPDARNLDPSKVGPRLWLVRERSDVYLIANNRPVYGENSTIEPAYALEIDPPRSLSIQAQREARRLFGEKDIVISIPVLPLIQAVRGREFIRIAISDAPIKPMGRIMTALRRFVGWDNTVYTVVLDSPKVASVCPA